MNLRKPLIGVTVNYIGPDQEKCPSSVGCYYANRTYIEAIEKSGGIPLPLTFVTDSEDMAAILDRLDGVFLTGGKDMDPSHFGEDIHPAAERILPQRTASEILLIRMGIERDLPLFGACLGLQTMNVALGGDLYQDLPSQHPSDTPHRGEESQRYGDVHAVDVVPGSKLHALVKTTHLGVNSLHHQAVRRIADGLQVTATAPDGIVEGLERPASTWFLGVQWHPEDLINRPEQLALFTGFIEAARVYGQLRGERFQVPTAGHF